MTINDRVALLLGRAMIRAEELTIRAEQVQAALLALQQDKSSAPAVPVEEPPTATA